MDTDTWGRCRQRWGEVSTCYRTPKMASNPCPAHILISDFWPLEPKTVNFSVSSQSVGTCLGWPPGKPEGSCFLGTSVCFWESLVWGHLRNQRKPRRSQPTAHQQQQNREITARLLLQPDSRRGSGWWWGSLCSCSGCSAQQKLQEVPQRKALNWRSVFVGLTEGQVTGIRHMDAAKLCFQKALRFCQ